MTLRHNNLRFPDLMSLTFNTCLSKGIMREPHTCKSYNFHRSLTYPPFYELGVFKRVGKASDRSPILRILVIVTHKRELSEVIISTHEILEAHKVAIELF